MVVSFRMTDEQDTTSEQYHNTDDLVCFRRLPSSTFCLIYTIIYSDGFFFPSRLTGWRCCTLIEMTSMR